MATAVTDTGRYLGLSLGQNLGYSTGHSQPDVSLYLVKPEVAGRQFARDAEEARQNAAQIAYGQPGSDSRSGIPNPAVVHQPGNMAGTMVDGGEFRA